MPSPFLKAFYRIAIALVLLALNVSISSSQSLQIEIKSSWGGLGEPSSSEMLITGSNGHYRSNGHKIDPRKIEVLLLAMDEPEVPEPSLANCGIDTAWLDANYLASLKRIALRKVSELSSSQIALFKAQFTDTAKAQLIFSGLFNSSHTDDFPEMSISVKRDGKTFRVSSDSQNPFMLPWFGPDNTKGGFNCRISQALAALLPRKFTNRERLTFSNAFLWKFGYEVRDSIKDEWNTLDAQNLVGNPIAPILAAYPPIKNEVSCLSSIDTEGCGWNAKLKGHTAHGNLILGVNLPYRSKKQISNVESFLHGVPGYIALVESVPWLSAYMAAHPNSTFELRFVEDRSLSTRALDALLEDLKKNGKQELADNAKANAMASAFLEVNDGDRCWSRILVFPNRDVLIWHFQCQSVLGFSDSQFSSWDYYGWHSVGALCTPMAP